MVDDTEVGIVTGNIMAEWMYRSRVVVQVRSRESDEADSDSVPSIPASVGLGDELDGVSENTTMITAEEDFETQYARSWRRIKSDSSAGSSGDLGVGVVDGDDHNYVGAVIARGGDTIYQLSSAGSSLTDLGDLPYIRTPESFISRRKRMQTMHTQMFRGDSPTVASEWLLLPRDFRPQALSGREWGDCEMAAIPELGLYAEVRSVGSEGKGARGEREFSTPPYMGVGYEDGVGQSEYDLPGLGSDNTREVTREEGVYMATGVAEVGVVCFPMKSAKVSGRMPEEEVLRPLTVLTGWS